MKRVHSQLVLGVFAIATPVAAQVSVDLSIEPSAVGWTVLARVSDPGNQTLGLHGMTLDVMGSSGASVGYSYIQTPIWTEANYMTMRFFTKGFGVNRFDSTNGLAISSSQDVVNRTSPISTNNNLLEGAGKYSFTETNVQNSPRTADCPLTIAAGEITGTGVIRTVASINNTTLLPPTLPAPTTAGAPFTPIAPAAVRNASWVMNGASLTSNVITNESLTVSGSVMLNPRLLGGQDSALTSLKFYPGGQFDIADNALTIDQASPSMVRGWISASQLRSSMASGSLSLGMKVQGAGVLVKRAIKGDATIDGKVNTLDFNVLAAAFGTSGNWESGDFNWDGTVNSTDFTLLVSNHGSSIPQASLGTTVPEPSAVMILVTTYFSGMRRRGRLDQKRKLPSHMT